MRKKQFAVLPIALSAAVALSACGGGKAKDTPKKEDGPTSTTSSIATEPGTFPVVKDKVTLTALVGQNAQMQDFATNEMTKWYEEKTNVHIDWQVITGDGSQITQKVNMILASGANYPDMFLNRLNKTQVIVYGSQGLFVPLNNLIDKYAVNLKKAMSQDEVLKNGMAAPDGNIYGLPTLGYTYHTSASNKMWVYKPWLDKLGLKAPTTTEEFYQMLKAFKEKDPNGNGKADEIAMASQGILKHTGMLPFLMNSFCYTNGNEQGRDYFVDNGKVIFSGAQPEFKEGLKYIKKLYDEGLIAKDSVTMDRKQITALAENPDVPLLGTAPALWYGMITVDKGDTKRYLDYVSLSPLKGPKGVQLTAGGPPTVENHVNITKSCKYPEVAVRWCDWFYTMEGNLTAAWGPEGTGWRKANSGEKGINGLQALYTILGGQSFGQSTNAHWSNLNPSFGPDSFKLGQTTTDPNDLETRLYNETKQKYDPYKQLKNLPDMFFTEKQATDLGELDALVKKAYDEGLAKVITSSKDIDKDWDEVMNNLNAVGLKKALEIRQQAYDANYKNKK